MEAQQLAYESKRRGEFEKKQARLRALKKAWKAQQKDGEQQNKFDEKNM